MTVNITAPQWIIEALARDAWEDLTNDQVKILSELYASLRIDWAIATQLNDNTIRLDSWIK